MALGRHLAPPEVLESLAPLLTRSDAEMSFTVPDSGEKIDDVRTSRTYFWLDVFVNDQHN